MGLILPYLNNTKQNFNLEGSKNVVTKKLVKSD